MHYVTPFKVKMPLYGQAFYLPPTHRPVPRKPAETGEIGIFKRSPENPTPKEAVEPTISDHPIEEARRVSRRTRSESIRRGIARIWGQCLEGFSYLSGSVLLLSSPRWLPVFHWGAFKRPQKGSKTDAERKISLRHTKPICIDRQATAV